MFAHQSSDRAVSACEHKPPDSEAERRTKLHEAAKQALRASSIAQAETIGGGATEQRVSDTSDEEQPLAQPKREESKDKKPKKPTQREPTNHNSVCHYSEVLHTQELGQHASRCDHQAEYLPRTRRAGVLPAARVPSTVSYNHPCYGVLPGTFECH